MKTLRSLGVFLLNLIVAVFAEVLTVYPVPHSFWQHRSSGEGILLNSGRSAISASIMGYWIYRRWKRPESKWVWLAAAPWCIVGLFHIPHQPPSVFDSYEVHAISERVTQADIDATLVWTIYFLPFIRTIFYSAGAAFGAKMSVCQLAAATPAEPGYPSIGNAP